MTDAAALERATDALAERYAGWTWSRDRWREIATLVLDAARLPTTRHEAADAPRAHRLRVHLRQPPEARPLRTPQPACTFARASQTFQLTDDPDEVTCHHCRRIIREMAA